MIFLNVLRTWENG